MIKSIIAPSCVLLTALASSLSGQDFLAPIALPAKIPDTIVIANRIEEPVNKSGSAVTLLDPEELEEAGLHDLEQALRRVPGALIASEGGQRGSISALRLRGTESDQTLFLVDGLRITDANVTPLNFLGAEGLGGYGRISVLRGPQSALFGSNAIGGVVSLDTGRGEDLERNSVFLEGGSFDTLRGGVRYGGETGKLRYFIGHGFEVTSNDRPNNDFEQSQTALRLETDLDDQTILGTTFRYNYSDFENPAFGSVAQDERISLLASLYLERQESEAWKWNVTLGFFRDEFEEEGDFPFASESDKASLEWRNEINWNEQHRTAAGILTEWSQFETSGVNEAAWLGGLYLNQLYEPVEGLVFGLGGRAEWFEAFQEVLTYRATASYQIANSGVRLHGSYGTGFRAPSFFELFGSIPAFFFEGNPDLDPETSRGWDVGVEYAVGESFLVDITYFQNDINDLIDFTPANVGNATTRGFEGTLRGQWLENKLEVAAAVALLSTAENRSTGERLIRRPRWTGSLDIITRPITKLTFGVGATFTGDRLDTDFSTFSNVTLDSSLLLRAHASYAVTEDLTITARAENILDDNFEEIVDTPGRGVGYFGGVRYSF